MRNWWMPMKKKPSDNDFVVFFVTNKMGFFVRFKGSLLSNFDLILMLSVDKLLGVCISLVLFQHIMWWWRVKNSLTFFTNWIYWKLSMPMWKHWKCHQNSQDCTFSNTNNSLLIYWSSFICLLRRPKVYVEYFFSVHEMDIGLT